jgi:hypothetical protein
MFAAVFSMSGVVTSDDSCGQVFLTTDANIAVMRVIGCPYQSL